MYIILSDPNVDPIKIISLVSKYCPLQISFQLKL